MTLDTLRDRIDAVDSEIVQLLNARFNLVADVAAIKRRDTVHAYVPERESVLLRRLCEHNLGPMDNETLRAIYHEIIAASRALEQPMTIAFLGPETTFTHQAAMAKFGRNVTYQPQQAIADIFDAVERGQVTYGVVPVENSTEGAVTYTLDMFIDTAVKICAEINIPIHHNLLSTGPREDVRVVYSHPQVFGQCRRWLHRNLPGVEQVEVTSTTEAAARCRREPGSGALAGTLAGERYDLEILERNIEDFTDNVTRFLVLGRQEPMPTGDDKTSMLFVVRDRVGALYDSLLPLRSHGINLTFIESRPSRRRNWDYFFYVDFLGHRSDADVQVALSELAEHCQMVKILGSYPRAVYKEYRI